MEVTPYVHWVVHHSKHSLEIHGPLGKYSCEAMEKHNSEVRAFERKNSNHHDRTHAVFLHENVRDELNRLKELRHTRE